MPTIVRKDGFSIRIHAPPREHPPPHVHVHKAGDRITVYLGIAGEPPSVIEVYGMRPPDVLKALQLVEEHQPLLISAWEKLHGEASAD